MSYHATIIKSSWPAQIEVSYFGKDEVFRLVHRPFVDDAKLIQMRDLVEQLPAVIVSITCGNARGALVMDDFAASWVRKALMLGQPMFAKLVELVKIFHLSPSSKVFYEKSGSRERLLSHADVVATLIINIVSAHNTEPRKEVVYWSGDKSSAYVSKAYWALVDGFSLSTAGYFYFIFSRAYVCENRFTTRARALSCVRTYSYTHTHTQALSILYLGWGDKTYCCIYFE